MESVNLSGPSMMTKSKIQVVSEENLNFGCDWTDNIWGNLVKGSVEMTFESEGTKKAVSGEVFSHLFKPSLITKEFLLSRMSEGRLDSEYEGILEIFIQQKEYWMDLSIEVQGLLESMITAKSIAQPDHLK